MNPRAAKGTKTGEQADHTGESRHSNCALHQVIPDVYTKNEPLRHQP